MPSVAATEPSRLAVAYTVWFSGRSPWRRCSQTQVMPPGCSENGTSVAPRAASPPTRVSMSGMEFPIPPTSRPIPSCLVLPRAGLRRPSSWKDARVKCRQRCSPIGWTTVRLSMVISPTRRSNSCVDRRRPASRFSFTFPTQQRTILPVHIPTLQARQATGPGRTYYSRSTRTPDNFWMQLMTWVFATTRSLYSRLITGRKQRLTGTTAPPSSRPCTDRPAPGAAPCLLASRGPCGYRSWSAGQARFLPGLPATRSFMRWTYSQLSRRFRVARFHKTVSSTAWTWLISFSARRSRPAARASSCTWEMTSSASNGATGRSISKNKTRCLPKRSATEPLASITS